MQSVRKSSVFTADFGRVLVEGGKDPHQNRLCFPCLPAGRFVTFFAQAKKVK